MKNISTLLGGLALLGVAILFYLHFSGSPAKPAAAALNGSSAASGNLKIAYFDIDSLQTNYKDFKDAEDQLKTQDSDNKIRLNSLGTSYQKRLKELQDKAPTMSQAEGEAAQRELATLQQRYNQTEVELDQNMKKTQMDMMTRLHNDVEAFLKEYNKEKGFYYNFAYQPGVFIYYKDSALDITGDMIKGLNEQYEKKKKEKK